MENDAENSTKTARVIGRPFPKGVSGNPGGRPKGTLKDYVKQMFIEMTDEEKIAWLEKHHITGIDQWKMAEGNPKQDVDTKVEGSLIIQISEDVAKKYDTTSNPETSSAE